MNPSELYAKAHAAGMEAFYAAKPVPMVVGTPKSLFSNEIDYSKPTEFVADGVCGNAWVIIKPARGKFVSYLKANRLGRAGDYGGLHVRPKGEAAVSQSMQRKEAYCAAFARVLEEAGITAYSDSRMD